MLFKTLNFILVALEVLLIFNLIIIVHELGHFLAGRWRGLVVEEFGVWFGKPLWRKKIGGVWYSLGSIPAGGFVKLPQLAPMEAIEGQSETPVEDLPPIKPLDKAIVAFAGPLFSFLLALTLGTVVWVVGKPASQADKTTVIGIVKKDGPADLAGMKPGDKILEIDGKKVTRFSGPVGSIMWGIMSSEGEKIDFLIERNGKQQHIISGWSKEPTPGWRRKPMRKVQIGPMTVPEIAAVEPKSVGEKAGLKKGDIVESVNGSPIFTLDQLGEIVEKAPTQPVTLTLKRTAEGKTATIEATLVPPPLKPGEEQMGPDFGVSWGRLETDYPTPWAQVTDSIKAMGNMIGAFASPKSDVKAQHFSGPIGIMNLYRRILESEEGWRLAIAFSVFFNVNLAMVNMLPFPVLDGGHIALALAEIVRRKPIANIRALEIVQQVGVVAIFAFMLYVSFFDFGDLFSGKSQANKPGSTPAPAAKTEPAK